MNFQTIHNIILTAKLAKRSALLETEGMEILEALGISTPRRLFLNSPKDFSAAFLRQFEGTKIVVKAVSDQILHKTEVGAVKITAHDEVMVKEELLAMEKRLKESNLHSGLVGYTLSEFITYDKSFGNEFLFGLRNTDDFGPVVTVGIGGIATEFLSGQLGEGKDVAVLSPLLSHDEASLVVALGELAVVKMATRSWRGQSSFIDIAELVNVTKIFLNLSKELIKEVSEFEINPIVIQIKNGKSKLVALDALVKIYLPNLTSLPNSDGKQNLNSLPSSDNLFSDNIGLSFRRRPVSKIKALLEPRTLTLVGVSDNKKNRPSPGRVILENILKAGFSKKSISIVKPDSEYIEDCQCYPDIESLPAKQDLVVLAVGAVQIPSLVQELIDKNKAEAIIVIPGGLEEKEGTEVLVSKIKNSLVSALDGPVINGGNCLGVRSLPGKINTLFIPEHKLPISGGTSAPLAFISQSGAFAITRISKLQYLNPKFVITLGNQMDLNVGDYFNCLKDDKELEVFAVYIEGFKPLDGLAFLRVAESLVQKGKTVILYRAGRTEAGAQASASHTASIAGNYGVTRALCKQAGVILAESLSEFEDLVRLSCAFVKKQKLKSVQKNRIAAVSNAGFECVTIADHLGPFVLADFVEDTNQKLYDIFEKAKISQIVDLHNPLDLTPMCADAEYEQVVATLLAANEVDAVVVGCVPLTSALQTLPLSTTGLHNEDMGQTNGLASRLIRLWQMSESPSETLSETLSVKAKPWLLVVDGGSIYDDFVSMLEAGGLPVFRSAERAMLALSKLSL